MQPIFETSVSKIMEIFHASKSFVIIYGLITFLMFKGFNFMLFYANYLFIQKLFVNLQPEITLRL